MAASAPGGGGKSAPGGGGGNQHLEGEISTWGGNQHLGVVLVLSRTSVGVRTKYIMHYLAKALKDNMCIIVIMTKL